MSIQRWAEGFRGGGVRATDGEWVRYDDHVAVVAKAIKKADLADAVIYHNRTEAYELGISAERARIRQAVKELNVDDTIGVSLLSVLSIIDTDRENES